MDMTAVPGSTVVMAGLDGPAQRRVETAAQHAGWIALVTDRLAEAEHLVSVRDAAALVLGPELASEEVVRRLRRRSPALAVVVWGSGVSSERAAELLLAGAGDVLGARMSEVEIFARIARAAGGSSGPEADRAAIGQLEVDVFRGEATWRGDRLPLTGRERDVLDVLVREQGKTLRREVIYQRVWGHAMPVGDRNVDVNVKRLRAKLRTATDDQVSVETVSRVGYRLAVAQAHDEAGGEA